jgi:hypothetical protein
MTGVTKLVHQLGGSIFVIEGWATTESDKATTRLNEARIFRKLGMAVVVLEAIDDGSKPNQKLGFPTLCTNGGAKGWAPLQLLRQTEYSVGWS